MQKRQKQILLALWILSSILLLVHFISPTKTECFLEEKEDIYTRNQTIIFKEKDKRIRKTIYKEEVSSSISSILDIKENEYEKKEYKISRRKNKIIGKYTEKGSKDYHKTVRELTEEGYTCKR